MGHVETFIWDMGNMHDITNNSEEVDYQGEFSDLVNDALRKSLLTISDLARSLGIDRGSMSRAVNGKRKLTYAEVVKISQLLGIVPPSWNKLGIGASDSRFLPLCGNIDATVWRVKGSVMTSYLSPIRPIDTGDDDRREQACYFVKEGPYSGEYAVCVKVNGIADLDDDDIVIVEETVSISSNSTELSRFILAMVQRLGEGRVVIPLIETEEGSPAPSPIVNFEVKGLVIGFFYRPTRKKLSG
jgi:plasmid maintenance system antidote protein VapI